MTDLALIKAEARRAAFARRKAAHETRPPAPAAHLSAVLAGYRGVPLSG
ncbi:MAG: 5-formyltetrahydrofolate cyclo-ligase, partial [Proteobacteria bacterium]|nr:5-formyltetrahydrofolate cyclo-ligase [Pseudomonadota bacterium]